MRTRGRKRDATREENKKKEGCLTVEDRGFGDRVKVKCSQHFPPVFDSGLKVCCCHRALTTLIVDLSVRVQALSGAVSASRVEKLDSTSCQ